MSSVFSTPKPAPLQPAPDPLPPAPERTDAATESLAAEQRARHFRRGSRASTMLTGGLGASGENYASRTLGGAARN